MLYLFIIPVMSVPLAAIGRIISPEKDFSIACINFTVKLSNIGNKNENGQKRYHFFDIFCPKQSSNRCYLSPFAAFTLMFMLILFLAGNTVRSLIIPNQLLDSLDGNNHAENQQEDCKHKLKRIAKLRPVVKKALPSLNIVIPSAVNVTAIINTIGIQSIAP